MSANTTINLIPHLCCRNASQAVEFYARALGAEIAGVFKLPNGRVAHADLNIGGASFYVVDEWPERGGLSPLALQNTPVSIYLRVPDCDAVFDRAVAAGCTVQMPPQDMFWGDRWSVVLDPYGHRWEIATTVRTVTADELQQTVSAMTECASVAEPAAAVAD